MPVNAVEPDFTPEERRSAEGPPYTPPDPQDKGFQPLASKDEEGDDA